MTTTTTPHKIPHNLLLIGTTASHAVMAAGAILLYWAGKIDATLLTAVLVGLGGIYSGVAGVVISAKGSQAVTPPQGGTPSPGAPAAPVSTSSATPVETAP